MNLKPISPLEVVALAAMCSRLAKCSVCAKITNTWERFGSFFLEEEYPWECAYVCSSDCMVAADEKFKSGAWCLPKLKNAYGGAFHDISIPRKGYDAQPSQDDLVKALLHASN